MIEADTISVKRGEAMIIDDLSLCIRPGQLAAIVGPNGSGKSTLIRAIAGDLPTVRGTIKVSSLTVNQNNSGTLSKRRSILSQSTSLPFRFRVFEVVQLGRTPHPHNSLSPNELQLISECLEETGISHLRDRLYPTLSGGEQQRVQLARALAQIWDVPDDQRVLLLDEPTSALDLLHQHATLQLARNFANRGGTVLVVLHDLNLAARYADNCFLMHQGAFFASGSPSDVFTTTNIAHCFGVQTTILKHPECDCPVIVTLDQ